MIPLLLILVIVALGAIIALMWINSRGRFVFTDCIVRNGLMLLYAGIAPKAPPKNGTPGSQRTLWHRIRYQYGIDAPLRNPTATVT